MLLQEFQEYRKILCVCPDCGRIVRLSDLKIKSKARVEHTWLDYYEYRERLMCGREAEFEEAAEGLREAAREEGRRQADAVFNRAIRRDFRRMKLDPGDIKPVLNPVDFLVFNGMNSCAEISDLVFLSKRLDNPLINGLRGQVKDAVRKKSYEWLVARIEDEGKIVFE